MIGAIKTFIFETFSNPHIAGALISAIPLIELRGGLPYIYFWLTKGYGVAPIDAFWQSFLTSFVGSSLVCPFLLLFFIPILKWLKNTKVFKNFGVWLETHYLKKSEKFKTSIDQTTDKEYNSKKQTFKYFTLFLFTAIPLPLTGVWSASAIAGMLEMKFSKALFVIVLGNFVAGLIISLLSYAIGVFV